MSLVSNIVRFFALQVSMPNKFVAFRDLSSVSKDYLLVDKSGKFIDLICIAGGFTSPNSKTSRTELREMTGNKKAYWNSDVYKTMYGKLSIEKLPIVKKSVMFSQIKYKTHGAALMMFLKDKVVYLVCNSVNFNKRQVLDTKYSLGDLITFKYIIDNGKISVYYQRNELKEVLVEYNVDFVDAYFKVGNYMQSLSPPEPKDSTSIVRIYSLQLSEQEVNSFKKTRQIKLIKKPMI